MLAGWLPCRERANHLALHAGFPRAGKNVKNSRSGKSQGILKLGKLKKKRGKVREKSGNFRIRGRNFKIVKEKQQVAMAVSSKNKHECVCHSV